MAARRREGELASAGAEPDAHQGHLAGRRRLQHGSLGSSRGEHSGQLEEKSHARPLAAHQALGQTPPEAALTLRLLRFTGKGSLVLLAATVVVSALIEAAEPKPRGLFSRLLSD
jgi:hypothetical protein